MPSKAAAVTRPMSPTVSSRRSGAQAPRAVTRGPPAPAGAASRAWPRSAGGSARRCTSQPRRACARRASALGQRRVRVLAVADRDHAAEQAVGQQVDRDVGERDGHHLVERVGIAGAQVVGEVAVHRLDAGAALQLVGQRLARRRPCGGGRRRRPRRSRRSSPPLPDGALAGDHEGVAGRVEAAIVGQEVRQGVEVERRLGDDAARARHVGRVPRRVAGVAAEDAEDADPLVAAERRALAVDELLGAGHRGREADAVLGAVHVVVHGLGDGDDREALAPEPGRVAERVVAADGDQRRRPRARSRFSSTIGVRS